MNAQPRPLGQALLRSGLVLTLLFVLWPGRLMAADPTPSALESDPSGWVDLLPGPDLKGWSRVPVPPGAPLGREQWHVDPLARVLICDGDGGHDMLLCDREFGDAVFHFEFRYTKVEGKSGYNSGRLRAQLEGRCFVASSPVRRCQRRLLVRGDADG
ncbi:MAG: DUF1080 domain-containing protein [Verrucomicrobia bacterium]|nr:DUF1080 domain-containing protein [Verrucomicrobiota bacterium]